MTCTGSTVGALIAFGANRDKQEATGVPATIYITFVVIQVSASWRLRSDLIKRSAIILDLMMTIHTKDAVRDCGRHLAVFKEPNLRDALLGLLAVLRDPRISILWPAMVVGEMCLALVSSINGASHHLFDC